MSEKIQTYRLTSHAILELLNDSSTRGQHPPVLKLLVICTHVKQTWLDCPLKILVLLGILCFAAIIFAQITLMHCGVTQAGALLNARQRQAVPLKYLKETWLSSLESFQIQSQLINLDRIPWYL